MSGRLLSINFELREYKRYKEEEILTLYQAVGWSNYFNKPEMLKQAYENSLYTVGAYLADDLVGVIRVVGDGASILYIQDLLIHPSHQRKGIGRKLFEHVIDKYQDVYQKVLITDDTEKTKAFYENMGFKAEGVSFIQYTI